MMKIIDIRCRPPFGYFINTGLFQPADMPFSADRFALRFGRVHAESARKKSFDLFLQEMEDAGITKAVVPVRRQQDSDNDTLVELLAQYPDLFIGSAGINHRDSEQAIGQIKKYVVEGPCKTIIMETGMGRPLLYASDESIFPIYEYCQEQEIPVMLSYGGFVGGVDIDYYHPRHIEVLAKTFPKLKIALCHGSWPWVTQVVHLAYRTNNIYVAPDIYAIHCAGATDYIDAANYMLHDKILYGSAYPIVDMPGSVRHYVSHINENVLPEIMWKNATKFLNLDI